MLNNKQVTGLAVGVAVVAMGMRKDGFLRKGFFAEQAKKMKLPIPAIVALVAALYLKLGKPKRGSQTYWAAVGAIVVGVYFAIRARDVKSPTELGAWYTPFVKAAKWAGGKASDTVQAQFPQLQLARRLQKVLYRALIRKLAPALRAEVSKQVKAQMARLPPNVIDAEFTE